MSNRLWVSLLWATRASAASVLASASTLMFAVGGDPVSRFGLLAIVFVVFFCGWVWPARLIWVLTLAIRIPVLALILIIAGMGKLLMCIDHVVALTGRRVLEVGNGR